MALVVTGATGAATSGAATSLTYSHTTNSGDDLTVVGGACGAITGITFNGDAFTEAVARDVDGFEAGLWYRVNPDIVTGNVVISQTPTWEISSGAVNFSGADTADPIGNTASASDVNTVDVTLTTSGNIVLDVIRNADQNTTLTAGANQTDRWNQATGAGTGRNKGAGSTEAAGGTITMSWTNSTSDNPRIAAAEINAVAGAGVAGVIPTLLYMGVG